MSDLPKPGFVLPTQQPAYNPGYPQPGYPPQQSYPPPPQQGYPPAYNHQPFPAPIQQQPGYGHPYSGGVVGEWYAGRNFQDYLKNATSFHVKQKVELLEAIVGWETPNKYTVKDNFGNKVFYVGEESSCCPRQFLGSSRPFTLAVKDTVGQDVLIFDRPLDCTCCCGLCLPDSLVVSTPNGQKIGSVKERCSLLYPVFDINDAGGNTRLKIQGPVCPIGFGSCAGPVVFRVMTPEGISVGTISKEWSGLVRELFTDADYFSMSFPVDLDISMKAVCLGALFLIDYEYFESGAGGEQGGRRLFG